MLKYASLCALVLAGALLVAPSSASTRRDGVTPGLFSASPSAPHPGDTVTFTVTLSGTANGTEVYTVSETAGEFSSIPTTIDGVNGSNQIQFHGTLSTSASGTVHVSASGNGGQAGIDLQVGTP